MVVRIGRAAGGSGKGEVAAQQGLAQPGWTGEALLKQSSGDAAAREAVALALLARAGGGRFASHFPAVPTPARAPCPGSLVAASRRDAR